MFKFTSLTDFLLQYPLNHSIMIPAVIVYARVYGGMEISLESFLRPRNLCSSALMAFYLDLEKKCQINCKLLEKHVPYFIITIIITLVIN